MSGIRCSRSAGAVNQSAIAPCSQPQPKNRRFSQRLLRPVRHILQAPQGSVGSSVTRSPGARSPTSGPRAVTTPTTSWPGRYGSGTNGWCPAAAWVSEPQTPASTVRTSTSPAPGRGTSAATTSMRPGLTTTRRIGLVGVLVTVPPRSTSGGGHRPGEPSQARPGGAPAPQAVGTQTRIAPSARLPQAK